MQGDPDQWWNSAAQEKETAELCRANGKWQQCYQHAGQSIEFALKAIYMQRNNLHSWPEVNKGAVWHSLEMIRKKAKIDVEFGGLKTDTKLYANWLTVKDWDSNARFPGNGVSKDDVTAIMVAAFNPGKGVYRWLEKIYHST